MPDTLRLIHLLVNYFSMVILLFSSLLHSTLFEDGNNNAITYPNNKIKRTITIVSEEISNGYGVRTMVPMVKISAIVIGYLKPKSLTR